MKNIKKLIIIVVTVQFLIISVIIGSSKIQDMTLATDSVIEYNQGWSMQYEDGTVEQITHIPFYGKSKAYETVIATNAIDEKLSGKTLCFYTADKNVAVYIEDKCIYSFGYDDKPSFGHTPGSVMNFVDIPALSIGKTISIKMQSAYDDYATYTSEFIVGDRDVIILYFIKDKILSFILGIGILICGIFLIILGFVQKLTNQKCKHIFSIGIYVLIMAAYHIVETKMLMVFYGNQYLYSNLVFLSLMTAAFFSEMYMYFLSDRMKKPMIILMILSSINICGQFALQICDVLDFMNMVFVSHIILGLVIASAFYIHASNVIKSKRIDFAFIGIFAMGTCGIIDIIRNYIVKIGDMGFFTRIGVFIFAVCEIITYLREIVNTQVQYAENAKLEIFNSELIQTLVAAIDAKDIYTKGHSTRVAEYSVLFAERLGWDHNRINNIKYKALLHDIGKIGVPDRVLNKADRLTDEEFNIIKSHTVLGSDMLEKITSLSDMNQVARSHHERFDGRGYPDRLKEYEIPEEARLVCIADSYDAMSSDRAYRKALPKEVIREELVKGRGSQFDPKLVDVFIQMFDEGVLDNIAKEHDMLIDNNDLSEMLNNVIGNNTKPGAVKIDTKDINNIYKYINGLHDRYKLAYSTVLISLEWDEEVSLDEIDAAMTAMEYSIIQSLRKVDVISRISKSQYLVILTEAHDENINTIMERIFASFFRNSHNTKIKPKYDINENRE